MKLYTFLATILIAFLLYGCGIYSFSGIAIGPEIKTFEVRPFANDAAIVIPNLDRELTTVLQDYILNQTNLDLTTRNGDIVYEGEIINYYIAPSTATANTNQPAAENRLTITVRMRYIDTKNEQNDLEKNFSFFFDFEGSSLLTSSQQNEIHPIIIERLTQDMVTETLARW